MTKNTVRKRVDELKSYYFRGKISITEFCMYLKEFVNSSFADELRNYAAHYLYSLDTNLREFSERLLIQDVSSEIRRLAFEHLENSRSPIKIGILQYLAKNETSIVILTRLKRILEKSHRDEAFLLLRSLNRRLNALTLSKLQELIEKENKFNTYIKYSFDFNEIKYNKLYDWKELSNKEKREKIWGYIFKLEEKISDYFHELFKDEIRENRIALSYFEEKTKQEKGLSVYQKKSFIIEWIYVKGKINHKFPSNLKGYFYKIVNTEFIIPIRVRDKNEGEEWKMKYCYCDEGIVDTNLAFTKTTYRSEANNLVLLKYGNLEFAFYESEIRRFHSPHDFEGRAYLPYNLETHLVNNLEVNEGLSFDDLTVDGAVRFFINQKT